MTDIEEIAAEVCKCSLQYDKPVYSSFMGETDVAPGIDILQRNKIPHYILPESMCCSFAAALKFRNRTMQDNAALPLSDAGIQKDKALALLQNARDAGKRFLSGKEAFDVLQCYGIPAGNYGMASSPEEAADLGERIGFPVAMKVVSEDIVHKVDVQGVCLNLGSRQQVAESYTGMMKSILERQPNARIEGVILQEMSGPGVEVILGIKRDISFGTLVLFGLDGIFVEIYKDVSFRIAPLSQDCIQSMISDIQGYPILAGARGRKKMDIAGIADSLNRLSHLAIDLPLIKELDINPLIVREEGSGAMAVDVKIVLS